jgi:hypothetical protein
MKTPLLSLLAGVALLAGCASQATTATKAPTNVTVTYQNPDNFTDVRENKSTSNSTYYLDTLKTYLQETAAPLIGADQKLAITVTDIDLAGENLFNQPNMFRVMRDIYTPKAKLSFQLTGADGKVIKEGERQLNNINYLMDAGRPGSSEQLYYDKLLLKHWLESEFGGKS